MKTKNKMIADPFFNIHSAIQPFEYPHQEDKLFITMMLNANSQSSEASNA